MSFLKKFADNLKSNSDPKPPTGVNLNFSSFNQKNVVSAGSQGFNLPPKPNESTTQKKNYRKHQKIIINKMKRKRKTYLLY